MIGIVKEYQLRSLHNDYCKMITEINTELGKVSKVVIPEMDRVEIRQHTIWLRNTEELLEEIYTRYCQSGATVSNLLGKVFAMRMDSLRNEVRRICEHGARTYKADRGTTPPDYFNVCVEAAIELITAIQDEVLTSADQTTTETSALQSESAEEVKDDTILSHKLALFNELGLYEVFRSRFPENVKDTVLAKALAPLVGVEYSRMLGYYVTDLEGKRGGREVRTKPAMLFVNEWKRQQLKHGWEE